MKVSKPRILFFARGYQTRFYPNLVDDAYEAVFVTLTSAEKRDIEQRGLKVVACFEEDAATLDPAAVPDDYLRTSLPADRFLGRFAYRDRIDLLGREIAWWSGILDTYAPIAVMNELVAIEISEVLYIEAGKRGIRYLAPMRGVHTPSFYWIPDPISLSGTHFPPITAGADAKRQAAEYMARLVKKDFRPGYVQNLSGRLAPKPLLAALAKYAFYSLRRPRPYDPARLQYETRGEVYAKRIEIFLRNLVNRYDRLEDLPEDGEILLYPLHQEPEAMLNYMSEFHASQVSTIENILKALGPNQVLIVKEHPVDKGTLLTKKFLDLRKRHSGLFFFPGEMSGRVLEPRLSRVVTLTSTVGWEMANLGKPVYVLGKVYYNDLPGITRIRDYTQLREQLRTPLAQAPRLDREAAETFIAELIERSYPGDPLPFADLYSPENIERVKHAIRDTLALG